MLRRMTAEKAPPLLDLDAARLALERAAARPRPGDRHILAWCADLVAAADADPLDIVLGFGALSPDARDLVGLLVQVAREVPSTRAGVRGMGHRAFVPPAAELAERLPAAVVRSAPLRREELLRRWAEAVGLGIAVGGEPESAERSARVLGRLDYARIREEEARLDAERTVAEARRAARAKVAAGGPL